MDISLLYLAVALLGLLLVVALSILRVCWGFARGQKALLLSMKTLSEQSSDVEEKVVSAQKDTRKSVATAVALVKFMKSRERPWFN